MTKRNMSDAEIEGHIVQSIRKSEPPMDLIVHGLALFQRMVIALEQMAERQNPAPLLQAPAQENDKAAS